MTSKVYIFIFLFNLINTLPTDSDTEVKVSEETINNDLPESNFFLDYIFKKYGNNEGKITYEGFEHLLENLGLGRLKFEKEHSLDEHKTEDGYFSEIHDIFKIHHHNHSGKNRSERSSGNEKVTESNQSISGGKKYSYQVRELMNKQCFTPEEMLLIYNLEPNHHVGILPLTFLKMCPVIVYELDQKSCSLVNADVPFQNGDKTKNSSVKVWLSAFISVLFISLVGLLGVGLVPLLQKAFFNELMSFLVALAVGTLCGDAFLHLLPHALEGEHDGKNSNMIVFRAGTVFLTVVFFFIVENLITRPKNPVSNQDTVPAENNGAQKVEIQLQEKAMLHSHTHKRGSSVSSVAYMVIMGDGLHNLTDGLAIGAAFSGDVISGFSTAIAVLTHELPHELGDFAVLLKTGMTVSEALFYNILSSILSFVGMVAGLLLGNFTSAKQWIYAITAGAFLYIGLVNLIPELRSQNTAGKKIDIFVRLSGIMSGGLIMLLIALYEHDLEKMFLQ